MASSTVLASEGLYWCCYFYFSVFTNKWNWKL